MPIDADGPSGLSDNADFDDLIVSLTSPTAAVAPLLMVIAAACSIAVDAVVPGPSRVRPVSNPVVSTDGRFMAFQVARVGDEPGAGRGILLYRFGASSRRT